MSENQNTDPLALLSEVQNQMMVLTDSLAQNFERFAGAMNGVVAHTLAMEGLLTALLRKYPVAAEDVEAWIRTNGEEDSAPEEVAKSLAIARMLLPAAE